jgi:hypothetical protein
MGLLKITQWIPLDKAARAEKVATNQWRAAPDDCVMEAEYFSNSTATVNDLWKASPYEDGNEHKTWGFKD